MRMTSTSTHMQGGTTTIIMPGTIMPGHQFEHWQ